ncbi:MAG TPA: glycosyltransferase, partial [Candidatus Nanoarchaeia archaeon]|nr:glycosyltransferase [Candidatus Nanoarchaeia archaeon]
MPAISLVLPIYNEAESISKDIPKLQDALAKSGWEFEIIAVNDCSSDNSAKELQKIKGITVLHNPENSGYSASIKR